MIKNAGEMRPQIGAVRLWFQYLSVLGTVRVFIILYFEAINGVLRVSDTAFTSKPYPSSPPAR
jgi:hypothetical protein